MGYIRTGSRWRWPNGVIPYTIDQDDFPQGSAGEQAIVTAIGHWSGARNLRIRPRNGEPHYVKFVAGDNSTTCESRVGNQGYPGYQKIVCNLTDDIVAHEIGHAIGLWHEHTRGDRDDFITLHPENILADQRHNFEKRGPSGTEIGPYDYDSIMHYGKRTFAVDWRPATRILGQFSTGGPALATFGVGLHLLHTGSESNDLWHATSSDGITWSPDRRVRNQGDNSIQRSKARPALAAWNGALHMVHLGDSSNDLWHTWTNDSLTWADNVRIDGQKSRATPGLVAFNGELHMVHIGESSDQLWHSWTADGQAWTTQKIPGQSSKAGPALGAFNGELQLVHLGSSSNRLWHSRSADGRGWTLNVEIEGQRSRTTPALRRFRGALHLAHIGDASPTIWHSQYDGTQWNGGWQPNDSYDNHRSFHTPALAVLGNDLHGVHRGFSSSRLWHTVFDQSLTTFDCPAGIMLGAMKTPSQGDIDAVNAMYP